MPKSIKRRIELLESRKQPRTNEHPPGFLLDAFEQLVAADHPLTQSPEFQRAWANYTTAREVYAAAGVPPPVWYLPDRPEAERRRLWTNWDSHDLNRVVLPVLCEARSWQEQLAAARQAKADRDG